MSDTFREELDYLEQLIVEADFRGDMKAYERLIEENRLCQWKVEYEEYFK